MKRNIAILEEGLKTHEDRIRTLSVENANLSKVVHEDNKLIPTLHSALVSLCDKHNDEQVRNILALVEELSCQRRWIIDNYKRANATPATDNVSVNAAIEFLTNKAIQNECKLTFSCSAKISDLIANSISQANLVSSICDLGENSIIATKRIKNPRVAIKIVQNENAYRIEFWDNGDRFDVNVLAKLGKKRITTHPKEGGSGIGLTSVYTIAKQCNASIVIDETPCADFTKCVSLCFDGKSEIRIITSRAEVMFACQLREDVKLIPLVEFPPSVA